jgi:hypothetical protein
MLPLDLLQRFETFSWGERDCVHFARAAREYFGAPAVEIPPYGSRHEALIAMDGCGGMLKMLVDRLGEPQSPAKAQIGDTVYATFRTVGEVVGVADPPGFWMLVESGGFVPVSLTLAKGVWPCRP